MSTGSGAVLLAGRVVFFLPVWEEAQGNRTPKGQPEESFFLKLLSMRSWFKPGFAAF